MLEFRKKQGASMINVLVFFMMAMMVSAQVFFFSQNSMQAAGVQTEAMNRRLAYEKYLQDAIEAVRDPSGGLAITAAASRDAAAYAKGLRTPASGDIIRAFSDQRKTKQHKDGNNICYEIYDLNYTLVQSMNFEAGYDLARSLTEQIDYTDKLNRIVFPPMGDNYYLIRVYEKYTEDVMARQKRRGHRLMYQVVVHKNGTNTPTIWSFQEVWY